MLCLCGGCFFFFGSTVNSLVNGQQLQRDVQEVNKKPRIHSRLSKCCVLCIFVGGLALLYQRQGILAHLLHAFLHASTQHQTRITLSWFSQESTLERGHPQHKHAHTPLGLAEPTFVSLAPGEGHHRTIAFGQNGGSLPPR